MNFREDTAALSIFAALIGGLVSYLRSHERNLTTAAIHLAIAGASGLLCWFACTALHTPEQITAITTGLAGHISAEASRLIPTTKRTA